MGRWLEVDKCPPSMIIDGVVMAGGSDGVVGEIENGEMAVEVVGKICR